MASFSRTVALTALSTVVQAATLLGRDTPYNEHSGLPTEDSAHPRGATYGKETEIHSAFPFTLEVLIAFAWVAFVGVVPIILLNIQGRGVTKAYYGLCICMYISLVGGLYMFTHIIMFNAYHWSGDPRALTLVECVYFMATVISTVGYGDITPAYPRGQVFVGIYVVCSMLVIAILISDLVSHMLGGMEASIDRRASRADTDEPQNSMQLRDAKKSWMRMPTKPCYWKLCLSFFVYLFFAITFVFFFYNWPGEDKTLFQCIYMSLITLSTVGFGAYYPYTEAGKAFLAFWMVFGSIALVNVITEFTRYCQVKREDELFSEETNRDALKDWQAANAKNKMDEVEFLKFFLVNQGTCQQGELDNFSKAFKSFGVTTPRGKETRVSIKDLSSSFSKVGGKKKDTK